MPYNIRVKDGKIDVVGAEHGQWYSYEEVKDMLGAISTYKTELKTIRKSVGDLRQLAGLPRKR